ncbi:MAG: ABC transporter permease [Coriobacteriia bacterium]|nr:ABC transporter permease [Coriobacteriia bacterium]
MRTSDLLHETALALGANKGRSALTVLGIVIGITAVVVMVSVISGLSGWLEDNMGLGSARLVTVSSQDQQHPLRYDDAEFLTRAVEDCEQALPVATTTATTPSQTGEADADDVTLRISGVSADYFALANVNVASGSLFDDDAGAAVLLGEDAVESIYGSSSANVLGQSLDIGGVSFTVVGVTESSSLTSGFSMDVAYVPYEALCQTLLGTRQVDSLVCQAAEDADVSQVAQRIEGALAARHVVEYSDDGTQSAYSAQTSESSLETLETFTLAFDALALLVAGIALLVGGIGIMNMMLTNVTERIREIGLRKSLGARPSDITLQFLAESVALCLIGGVAGIALGYAGAWGLTAAAGTLYPTLQGLTPVITPGLVLVVFGICAGIGVVFGYYPARRAAKLSPAETLRYQ